LRLNKAYAQFDWSDWMILLGHHYHPIARYTFPTGDTFYPHTLSSAWGIGFDPFRYVSQGRFLRKYKNYELLLAFTKFYNSQEARWATRPDIFLQISGMFKEKHILAVGLSNNVEIPRIETDLNFKTAQQVQSVIPFISAIVRVDPFRIYSRFIYASRGDVFELISGYAVNCYNSKTDERNYVPLRAINFWADIVYEGLDRAEPGLFIGVSKNIGASQNIIKSAVNSEGETVNLLEGEFAVINNMFILSPRLRMRWGPMVVGAEIEYLRAAFARRSQFKEGWENDFDCRGRVTNTCPVSNTRFLVATRYYF
jgi:hypothetical protein